MISEAPFNMIIVYSEENFYLCAPSTLLYQLSDILPMWETEWHQGKKRQKLSLVVNLNVKNAGAV